MLGKQATIITATVPPRMQRRNGQLLPQNIEYRSTPEIQKDESEREKTAVKKITLL